MNTAKRPHRARLADADAAKTRRVLVAASVGTVFEWYYFFLYGSLAVFFSGRFFPPGNETAAFLASLATFGAGFAVRPLGALLFGALGDRIGRKRIMLAGMGPPCRGHIATCPLSWPL
jgi:MFS family permease